MSKTTDLFSRKQIKNYAIVDYDKFAKQTEVRMLALSAAAVTIWLQEAKSTFSASTAAKYADAIYWDAGNPNNIRLGVLPNTLGDILEHGQNPYDLRTAFLKKSKVSKKGTPYRIIPLGGTETTRKEATPFMASVASIRSVIQKKSPNVAEFIIRSQMSRFNRTNVAARSASNSGRFIPKENAQFRTITGFSSADSPKLTWQHPGIRAALLGNKVSAWMDLNRESFTADLFQGDPEISK